MQLIRGSAVRQRRGLAVLALAGIVTLTSVVPSQAAPPVVPAGVQIRSCVPANAGVEWTSRTSAVDNEWTSVAWGGLAGSELFVAVSRSGTGNRVMTSPDGINWTSRASAADNAWNSLAWSPVAGLFVAVASSGTGNRVMTSPDGINWTTRTSAADNDWRSVTWGGPAGLEKFVAVARSGTGNRVMTSPDGINWTLQTSAADNDWRAVTWGGPAGQEKFVAVAATGAGNRVMTSPDGINWTLRTSAADNIWLSVTWGGPTGLELFVAVARSGTGNRVMTSPEGITWTSRASATDNDWRSVTWGGQPGSELFVALSLTGTGNRVMTSPDGINWTSRTSAADIEWFSVTWGGPAGWESFVGVAETGTGNRVMTSSTQSCPPPPRIPPGPPMDVRAEPGLLGARVTWMPPVDPGTDSLTLYAVRAWPGGPVCQVYSLWTSCDVTGLDPNVDYYFTVVAMSGAGWGTASQPSNPIRPLAARVPSAPIDVTATAGDTTAEISWSPPTDPGSGPVLEYRVTSTSSGGQCVTAGRACLISGLTNGTSYQFTVEARNSVGWGTASAPSNAVTPQTPSLTITASRDGRSVLLAGLSAGVSSGTPVTVWMRIGRESDFVAGVASVVVAADGTFAWQRRLNPSKAIALYVTSGDVRSNTATLPAQERTSP